MIADDWECHKENEAFPTYVVCKVLIKKWEWFLKLDQDEELYCQKVAREPGVNWKIKKEYDGESNPEVEVGAKSDSDKSTDSEVNGDFPGN